MGPLDFVKLANAVGNLLTSFGSHQSAVASEFDTLKARVDALEKGQFSQIPATVAELAGDAATVVGTVGATLLTGGAAGTAAAIVEGAGVVQAVASVADAAVNGAAGAPAAPGVTVADAPPARVFDGAQGS